MLGTTMFSVSAAIFYTQVIGLPVAEVGLALGISAVVGIFSGVPVGRLADRRGPRELYIITLIIQAFAAAAMIFIQAFWSLLVLVCLTQLAQSASQAARGPIVRRFSGENPAKFRAYLRATVAFSYCLTAPLAALAIQFNTRGAYIALILGNAVSYLVTAAMVTRLPAMEPIKTKAAVTGRRTALKDHPFVLVTAFDGIMSIQGKVLTFALPLWIVDHTHAPRWFVGASVILSTLMIVALQVKTSRGVDTDSAAARVWRRSGWAFLIGMVLISLSSGVPGWLAAVLILLGVGVQTLGELQQAAGSFQLRYSLAPAHMQGQYSGVFLMGSNLGSAIAPSVLGFFCITWGEPGWWVMGGIFGVVGLALPHVVRWAERTRPESNDVAEVV
jgi:MFS family permease